MNNTWKENNTLREAVEDTRLPVTVGELLNKTDIAVGSLSYTVYSSSENEYYRYEDDPNPKSDYKAKPHVIADFGDYKINKFGVHKESDGNIDFYFEV